MRVLLKEKILNLGTVGDQVDVRSGYARNFLIPQDKAMAVNKENIAEFEKIRKDLEATEADKLAVAQKRADILQKQEIIFESKVKESDQIFGSITVSELADMYAKHDLEVLRSELKIIDGPVKTLGEYDYILQVHPDLSLQIKFKVISDKPTETVSNTKKNASVKPVKTQVEDVESSDKQTDDEV